VLRRHGAGREQGAVLVADLEDDGVAILPRVGADADVDAGEPVGAALDPLNDVGSGSYAK